MSINDKQLNNSIILHRSLGSPYSEKIMLLLRYAGLDWLSVATPKGMPRPIQQSLVGNYSRRVPILQIGSDLYCDTSMIMDKLSSLSADKSLSPMSSDAEFKELLQLIESDGTLSMLGVLTSWNFLFGYFKLLPFPDAVAFIKDRKKLAEKHSDLKNRKSKQQWMVIAKSYLSKLNDCLNDSLFLTTSDRPNAADFSAYTMIWYHDILTNLTHVKEFENIMAWYQRMVSFNNNEMTAIAPELALGVAKHTEPAPIPVSMMNSPHIGQTIDVPINDVLGSIICQPISGVLAGEDNYSYIIKNENAGKN